MTKYILLTKKVKAAIPLITIDESAKLDFMELMKWDKAMFEKNTLIIGERR